MKFYIILSFILLLIFSCRKEQPSMTPILEECSCAHEVSADFTMEEQYHNNPNLPNLLTETDSIFSQRYVRFTAKESDAEYHWYVGTEEIYDPQFVRFFPNTYDGQNLPLTLVVKKKPNKICFPNDDGYDSIKKYINVTYEYDYESGAHPLEGQYKLKGDHLPDSTIMTFNVYYNLGTSNGFEFFNYDGLGNDDSNNYSNLKLTYHELVVDLNGTIYGAFESDLHYLVDGTVTFDLLGKGPNTTNFHFKGRKL